MAVSRMRNTKICKLALTCGRIAYELGYGADTVFHRTYFLLIFLKWVKMLFYSHQTYPTQHKEIRKYLFGKSHK